MHTAELEHLIRSGGREAAEVYERPAKWTQNPMEAPCATGRRAHLGVTGRLWDVINGVPSESLLSLGSKPKFYRPISRSDRGLDLSVHALITQVSCFVSGI